jgi:hypothetical protein
MLSRKPSQFVQAMVWSSGVERNRKELMETAAMSVFSKQPENQPVLSVGVYIKQPTSVLSHLSRV